jgi:hypothetical protein
MIPIDKKMDDSIIPSLDCANDKFIQKYWKKSMRMKYLFLTVVIAEQKIK